MIEIEHLSKRYGEHLAVSDLSVTIEGMVSAVYLFCVVIRATR